MGNPDLYATLLDEAKSYNPAEHTGSLLAPFRDVLLLQRAKYMSYEQISATLTRHGLKASPAAVGVFCRRNFTKAEIDIERRKQKPTPAGASPTAPAAPSLAERGQSATQPSRPAPRPAQAPSREPGKRGPKIARDDF